MTSLIDLFEGWPNTSLLPTSLLHQASSKVLMERNLSDPALSYGPDPGYEPLRIAIAQWLSDSYHSAQDSLRGSPPRPIDPNRITITGGASQNLACLLQVFTDPIYTRHVWMVVPTYYQACRIFEDSCFAGKMRAVPEDIEGIDIDFLRQALSVSEEKAIQNGNVKPNLKPTRPYSKYYKHIIYAVPTFSNPSGKIMTLRRRQELVRLARESDALIITDDVYDFLQWPYAQHEKTSAKHACSEDALPPRVVDVDGELDGGTDRAGADGFGNVASNGSFSKICGPGNRTGWVEGTTKLAFGVANTGTTLSGGAPAQLTAAFLSLLLEEGQLQQHITNVLRPALARRHRKTMNAIETYLFPLGVTMGTTPRGRRVAGGYFLWFSLPEGLTGRQLALRAKEEENVRLASGNLFQVWGDESAACFDREIRLCFAWVDEELLVEGIVRVAAMIKRMLGV